LLPPAYTSGCGDNSQRERERQARDEEGKNRVVEIPTGPKYVKPNPGFKDPGLPNTNSK
jgi:hypothetical protein